MSTANSIVIGQKSTISHIKSYTRSQTLSWNPISRLTLSKPNGEICLWGNKTRVQCDNNTKRNSFVVYANSVPGTPPPPPPSNPMSWILGLVISFVLPFFTNKWGPLWVLKSRVEDAVQTVENIVEAVEKAAEEVDKIAGDIADDLPEGKLKNLVEMVEDAAERTAKAADSLDNVIDKVQEAEDQVEDMVESTVKEAKNSPEEAKSN